MIGEVAQRHQLAERVVDPAVRVPVRPDAKCRPVVCRAHKAVADVQPPVCRQCASVERVEECEEHSDFDRACRMEGAVAAEAPRRVAAVVVERGGDRDGPGVGGDLLDLRA